MFPIMLKGWRREQVCLLGSRKIRTLRMVALTINETDKLGPWGTSSIKKLGFITSN